METELGVDVHVTPLFEDSDSAGEVLLEPTATKFTPTVEVFCTLYTVNGLADATLDPLVANVLFVELVHVFPSVLHMMAPPDCVAATPVPL